MIKTLYGVNHGGVVEVLGTPLTLDIEPSRGLLAELALLPPGSRVGIELESELVVADSSGYHIQDSIDVDGEEVPLDIYALDYWNTILGRCHRCSLVPVFVEDLETYTAYVRKKIAARDLKRNLEFLIAQAEGGNLFPVFFAQEILRGLQDMYKLTVEAEYTHAVEREQKLVERSAHQDLDGLLLGRGHTDVIVHNREAFAQQGFVFEHYCAEDGVPVSLLLPNFSQRPVLLREPQPERETVREREALLRRYRAITTGRVTAEGTPDFIGTWDPQVPARGLFEVFVEDPGGLVSCGRIEDVHGTANLNNGHFNNGTLRFDKFYLSDTVPQSANVPYSPIHYEGRRVPDKEEKEDEIRRTNGENERGESGSTLGENGERYEGTFEHPRTAGKFLMRKM